MTTLHMEVEAVRQVAQTLRRGAEEFRTEAEALQQASHTLAGHWMSGSQAAFAEALLGLVRTMNARSEQLQELADRVAREAEEWEEVDLRGQALFQGVGEHLPLTVGQAISGARIPAGGRLPGGGIDIVSAGVLFWGASLIHLPPWLEKKIREWFPALFGGAQDSHDELIITTPPPVHRPPAGSSQPSREGSRVVYEPRIPGPQSQSKPKPAPAQPQPKPRPKPKPQPKPHPKPKPHHAASSHAPHGSKKWEIYYDVKPESQGHLYGNAACAPTSVSMITQYYHHRNPKYKAVSPAGFVRMLDKGDGVPTQGVSWYRIEDDIHQLGYNVQYKSVDVAGLRQALKQGPVVVPVKIGLRGGKHRDIIFNPRGRYSHAVVVKGISKDAVLIADPWSGKNKTVPLSAFRKSWRAKGHWVIMIRPRK